MKSDTLILHDLKYLWMAGMALQPGGHKLPQNMDNQRHLILAYHLKN
jgi:hypothetical protein